MPVADVLSVVDPHQLADCPLVHEPVERREEWGVAQDVGHGDRAGAAARRLADGQHPLERWRDRLFQKDVAPVLQRRDARLDVLAVRGGDDDRLERRTRVVEEEAPVGVDGIGLQGVVGCESRPLARVGVGAGHDPEAARIGHGVGAIGAGAALATADDGDTQGTLEHGRAEVHRGVSIGDRRRGGERGAASDLLPAEGQPCERRERQHDPDVGRRPGRLLAADDVLDLEGVEHPQRKVGIDDVGDDHPRPAQEHQPGRHQPQPPGRASRSDQGAQHCRARQHERHRRGGLHGPHLDPGNPLGQDGDPEDTPRQGKQSARDNDPGRRPPHPADTAAPHGVDLSVQPVLGRRLGTDPRQVENRRCIPTTLPDASGAGVRRLVTDTACGTALRRRTHDGRRRWVWFEVSPCR